MEQTASRYLSAKGLREKLSIGQSKAYQLLYMFDAQGKTVRIGKCVRIREEHVDEWLKGLEGQNDTND